MSKQITEGWVIFDRFYCLTGYIDKWVGDSMNDPNRDWKHSLCGNSRITYFRINQYKWVSFNYHIDLITNIDEYKDLFSAEEIWNFTLNNKT